MVVDGATVTCFYNKNVDLIENPDLLRTAQKKKLKYDKEGICGVWALPTYTPFSLQSIVFLVDSSHK